MSKPRILVVDDDPKISNLLAVILTRCGGYEVREENCSTRAIRTAEEFSPHAILFDVDRPDRDGGALEAELAEHPTLAHVPTLFVTPLLSSLETSGHCLLAGEHYFLSKPVLPGLLMKSVHELLETGEMALTG